MKTRTVLLLICFVVFAGTTTLAIVNQGAEKITIDGGKKGNVEFPHREHQETLEQKCKTCHDLFPQESGIIRDLKNKGKLQKKQVMNKKCLNCHKQRKKAGKDAGPVKCKGCHIK